MVDGFAARAFYGQGNDAPFAQLPAAVAAAKILLLHFWLM
jgi:hypothetical protein